MSSLSHVFVLVIGLAGLAQAGSACAQDGAPIATHQQGPAPSSPALKTDLPAATEADPFGWLRRPDTPEAGRWRATELQQEQRWLKADAKFPRLREEAEALQDDGPTVQNAGGRLYVRSASTGGRRVWKSRAVFDSGGAETAPRAEPAMATPVGKPSAGSARVICDPTSGRVCLLTRRVGSSLMVAGYEPALGTSTPDPFQLPSSALELALEGETDVLVVVREDGAPVVRRVTLGQSAASAPVVFRGEVEAEITPGAAVSLSGDRVSWLTVRRPGGRETLLVYAGGAFRPLQAPAGSTIVGVVRDQLVLQLREGWEGVAALPAGALLSFDLKPLLTRAPELTPRAVLKLSDTPDIRQVAATRSALVLVAREGAAEVAYLCEPGLRGWAVRRLASTAADRLEIAAADARGDVAVLRAPAFPDGDRLQRLDMRTGVVEQLSGSEDFAGRPRRTFPVTALDGAKVGYTVVSGPDGPNGAPRHVLLTSSPRDGREAAVLRTLGSLWLAHGGDLAVAAPRQRRYVAQEGLAGVLVGYEDLSAIARDLADRALASRGGITLAGFRTSASLAAIDLVKHPSQWAAAVLIDPVTDPVGAQAEAAEPWAQVFATARGGGAEGRAWHRIAPYDALRPSVRYAPVLTIETPEAPAAFASDGARFTARLNAVAGDSLHVAADSNARASALAVAFLMRVLGVTG